MLSLGAIEQRAVAGGGALSVDRRRQVARVEKGRGQMARERVGEPPDDRVERYALVDGDDGQRRRSRTHGPGGRSHHAELLGESAGQRERQCGGCVEQLLEVGAIHGEQIDCARGPHRRRAGCAGEQGELADGVPATDLADRRAGGLVDDLHPAGADDVERVPGISLVEQPGAGGHAYGARAFRHRLAERRFEGGEHRHLRQELGGRLGPRRQRRRRIGAHQPPRGRRRRSGRGGCRLVDQDGASCGRQRRQLDSRSAPDEEAAEPGDDEAHGTERPGAIERGGGLGWGRCPENRDDERDAQRRADLTCHGVQAGGRRVPGSWSRGDRRRGQIREQRAGAEPEQKDAGQPLADEVRGDADARNEPEDGRAPEQPAGDKHRPRPDSHDEVARGAGDGSGDERPRRQREASLEHGVVPHRGEEEDVDQRVAVEAGAGEDRRGVGDAERPAAQQREVHDRRTMRRAAPDEDCSEHERSGERAQHPCVEPAPFRRPSRPPGRAPRSPPPARARPAGRASAGGRAHGSRPDGGARTRTVAMPIGTLTRNTRRQLPAATRSPPSEGPSPAAPAATADSSATPCDRRSAGNESSTRASDDGTRSAAPSACSTRNAVSVPGDGATAHSTDATVNSSSPLMKTRRRPMRSARRPAATRKAAKTML